MMFTNFPPFVTAMVQYDKRYCTKKLVRKYCMFWHLPSATKHIHGGNHGKKRQIQNVVDFDFYYNTTVAAILNFSIKETGIYWLLSQ